MVSLHPLISIEETEARENDLVEPMSQNSNVADGCDKPERGTVVPDAIVPLFCVALTSKLTLSSFVLVKL